MAWTEEEVLLNKNNMMIAKFMVKEFPNGFLNWFETSVEISDSLFTALKNDRIELEGRGELWELIENYTDEFEKKYEGVEWGIEPHFEWFDTVDAFIEEKIKLLEKR